MNQQATVSRLVLGGNKPPINELLTESYKDLKRDLARWTGSADRMPAEITDDDTLTSVGMTITELAKVRRAAEEHRKTEKEPYLRDGQAVDKFFKDITDTCATAEAKLELRQRVFVKKKEVREREAARLAEEIARREADELLSKARHAEDHGNIEAASELLSEAATQETAASSHARTVSARPQDVTRVRAGGVTVSAKSVWVGRIDNYAEMDLNELRCVISSADAAEYVKRAVKLGIRTLKGCTIEEDRKVNNRS